jgi:hypothetical protein
LKNNSLRLRLQRRTSINSISELHKEKEMADFRRWIYALALVALLAGFTVPVSAQNAPLECIANAGVPPTVRAEGWTELMGDLTLNCTGGVSTPPGQIVQPVNVQVTINTYLTSRILSGNFIEALLIIDEPHSATNTNRPILNCGAPGAADSGPSGRNVCAIVEPATPNLTYDGTPNVSGATTCGAANTYSCGRPNVFQGQLGTPAVSGQTNAVTWLGVPLDPPGTTTNRTIRITNIRADAHDANGSAAPGNFVASYITAQISINGNTSLSLNNPQQIVAFIGPGLVAGISATNFGFLQCVAAPAESPIPAFTWTEGFASSWKAKNIAMILNTATAGFTGNGVITPPNSYWTYGGTINYPTDLNQNVPGAIYNTESGFEYPGTNDPTPNPPPGIGTFSITPGLGAPLTNATGIAGAGIANTGTRLQFQISNIPVGATVTVPDAIYLNNGTINSGLAMLVNTDSSGAGAYSPVYTGTTATAAAAVAASSQVPSSGLVVYEVIFADPFSVEKATVQATVTYTPNLNLNQPTPNQVAQAFGGFAPFYSTAAAHLPSSTLTIPRFVTAQIPSNLNFFEIVRCACNLLFPFVSNQGGYDTGIAIANTSLDNLGVGGISAASSQFGGVQFWYYGTLASGGAAPPTQCTNVASPGTCPTPNATSSSSAIGQIPAGQVLTYVLSTSGGSIGNGPNGLAPNWAAGFQGYVIAQAQFQYCHAYAFITAAGAGPLSAAVSEGYLGLLLDNGGFVSNSTGIVRTNQRGESLVH